MAEYYGVRLRFTISLLIVFVSALLTSGARGPHPLLSSMGIGGHRTFSGGQEHVGVDQRHGLDELGQPGVNALDPHIYQYFVPFNDDNLHQSFADVLGPGCLNDSNISATIASTIAIAAGSADTRIFYDHWEDGYDPDPTTPGPTTEVLTLNAGQPKIWQDNVTIPRSPRVQQHDSRDRITIIDRPVQAVRAAWLTRPGTRLAGAWEMTNVSDWGRKYIIPIGEDIGRRGPQSFGDYDYVSAEVMAAYNGTIVQIDANADGIFETTRTLNIGETAYLRGSANQQGFAIVSGAKIDASLPVQVQVRAGNCRAPYSGRSYTLVPLERWSNEYWSPVTSFLTGANSCQVRYLPPQNGRGLSADVDIYIYNPNSASLPVTYTDASGTGVITIPPRSTGSYLHLHPNPTTRRSNTQGVRLIAPSPFTAVTAVDSTSLGNNGADFDWSYSLIPSTELSARTVLSWAPGSGATPPTSQINGSTAYVQATIDGTRVFADLNGDNIPNQFDTDGDAVVEGSSAYGYNELTSNAGIVLNAGQMVRVSDPIDHDMTGAIIYSQDSSHQLAIVYGEDACVAEPQNPFLDLGYTVLPQQAIAFSKSAQLVIDADRSGGVSPGDTLEYTVQASNNGVSAIENPTIIDTLPYTYTDLVVGTIQSTHLASLQLLSISFDDGNNTFTAPEYPQIHAFRVRYSGGLQPNQMITITFLARLDTQIPPEVQSLTNYALLTSSNMPPKIAQVSTPINRAALSKSARLVVDEDRSGDVSPGDTLEYSVQAFNIGVGPIENPVILDTLPYTYTSFLIGSFSSVPPPLTPPGVTYDDGSNTFTYVPTGAPGTPDPLIHAFRVRYPTLLAGQSIVFSFRVQLHAQIPPEVQSLTNNALLTSSNTPPETALVSTPINQVDVQVYKDDGREVVQPLDQITYTLTYTNAGPGLAYNTVMTDTFPPTAINVSTPTVPGVITPTIEPGRIIFQLGTLQAGIVGKTTVTMTLGSGTPQGLVVNSATINTRSSEFDLTNNDSVDINRVTMVTPRLVYLPLVVNNPPPPLPDLVVDQIVAGPSGIVITIRNQGSGSVSDSFWIDVYIQPDPPPSGVNQVWQDQSREGLVWGITEPALPLAPGAALTLRIGDTFFHPELSRFSGGMVPGTPIYAQVDSVNLETSYGGVLESHERDGGVYNNIGHAFASASGVRLSPFVATAERPRANLPVRLVQPGQ